MRAAISLPDRFRIVLCLVLPFLPALARAQANPDAKMGFFITSAGLGKGGDLGGLAGADKHCQDLAEAVGAGDRAWRAYLSTQAAGGQAAVNARDRIGKGPWYNYGGVLIASNLEELHGQANKIGKQTGLTEKGATVNGRGDSPNQHDMLTGTHADGSAYSPDADMTCANWTSSSAGKAMLGHHDRHGVAGNIDSNSWVEAHASSGCGQSSLIATGGNGYFYCFASDTPTGLGRTGGAETGSRRLAWTGFGAGADLFVPLRTPASLSLRVEDLSGRLLAELDFGRLPSGEHRLHWDGRDASGRVLPWGFYALRMRER